jgi:DNA-binding MurR/RpiR family transcriptional regulator
VTVSESIPQVIPEQPVVPLPLSTPFIASEETHDDNAGPLVRIRSLLPGLARAEQRVAKVVLDDPSAVASRSITEVALSAGTSETTVTRFCKAIGVGGYPQLRIALAADAARMQAKVNQMFGGDIDPDDDLGTIVNKISFADARAVEDTANQLQLSALNRVIDAVVAAGRVDIYGVGASAFMAADLQHKLHRMAKVSFAWSDTHVMLTSAAVLTKGDVAIAISHSGATTDTLEALRVAKEHGATTVAMTNFPRSPITTLADHTLTTAARETTFRSGSTASRIAQLTLIDCLFVGVAQRMGPAALVALDPARDATGTHRLGVRHDRRRKQPHAIAP